jgi:hypothetical protein
MSVLRKADLVLSRSDVAFLTPKQTVLQDLGVVGVVSWSSVAEYSGLPYRVLRQRMRNPYLREPSPAMRSPES